jgi:hypothetical protein
MRKQKNLGEDGKDQPVDRFHFSENLVTEVNQVARILGGLPYDKHPEEKGDHVEVDCVERVDR